MRLRLPRILLNSVTMTLSVGVLFLFLRPAIGGGLGLGLGITGGWLLLSSLVLFVGWAWSLMRALKEQT